jgi:signal transduction histidine kinase/HAMP domain-containing protein
MLSWVRSSLRTKLALAMAFVSLVPLTIAGTIAAYVSLERLERSLVSRAEQTAKIGLNLLLRHVERLRRDVDGLSRAPELIDYLGLQPRLIRDYMRVQSRTTVRAMIQVIDRRGRIVAELAPEGRDYSSLKGRVCRDARARILDFERYLTLTRAGGRLAIQSAAPVIDSEFVLLGGVIETVLLDDALADFFKSVLRAEVGFFDGVQMPGSTFMRAGERLRSAGFYQQLSMALGIEPRQRVARIDGHELTLAFSALQNVQGQRLGYLVVGLDRSAYLRARHGALRALLIGLLTALLVAFAVSAFVGRRITKPLARLHRGIQAMATGAPASGLATVARDEIGELSRAFQDLSELLARNERRLDDRIRELSTLHQIGKAVGSVLRVNAVLHIVVSELAEVLNADRGAVLTFGSDGELTLRAHVGLGSGEGPPALPARWLQLSKRVVQMRATEAAERLLVAQLETRDRQLGALLLARGAHMRPFSKNDVRLVETFADQAASAIDNAELYEAARLSSERMERAVERRTAELKTTNEELERSFRELKDTQAQLILSERLAGLGSLVAGVAHEINTPTGTIQGASEVLSNTLTRALLRGAELAGTITAEETRALFDELGGRHGEIMRAGVRPPSEVRQRAKLLVSKLPSRGPAGRELVGTEIGLDERLVRRLISAGAEELLPRVVGLAARVDIKLLVGLIEDLTFVYRSVHSIRTANDRVVRIVKALRSYSHVDQGGAEEVDLTEGIETTLTILHNMLQHGIVIKRNYAPIPKVSVYLDQLNQVWTNLIHNAVQALRGKGTISIETYPDGEEVGVRIVDDGPGIPAEVLPRIFEPHFSTKPRGEGTGLGLSIARKIVEKHGGQLAVQSRPGRTEFTVLLPVSGPPRNDGGILVRTQAGVERPDGPEALKGPEFDGPEALKGPESTEESER